MGRCGNEMDEGQATAAPFPSLFRSMPSRACAPFPHPRLLSFSWICSRTYGVSVDLVLVDSIDSPGARMAWGRPFSLQRKGFRVLKPSIAWH